MPLPRAQEAAEWYVAAKHFETALPEFRQAVKTLRKAVGGLVALLPDTDDNPPFAQMRALYCYGDPTANGNKAGTEMEQREDHWDERLSPMAVKTALVRWQQLIDDPLRAVSVSATLFGMVCISSPP